MESLVKIKKIRQEMFSPFMSSLLFLKQSALVVVAMEATAMKGRSASVRMGFMGCTVRKVTIFI